MVKCPWCGKEVRIEEYSSHYESCRQGKHEVGETLPKTTVGTVLVSKARDRLDMAKRELQWFKEGRTKHDVARYNMFQYLSAIDAFSEVAEALGLSEFEKKIEFIKADALWHAEQIPPS